MLGHDGRELLMMALLGYSYGNLDDMREMILHPNAALGLSDGGAHCGAICDASHPDVHAHALGARPRPRRAAAARAGRAEADARHRRALRPRRPRRRRARACSADLNVIDFDALSLALPELVHDLPGGARRLIQRADGYRSHVRRRRGDHARRRGDRRPARQARAGHAMSSAPTCSTGATSCSQTAGRAANGSPR